MVDALRALVDCFKLLPKGDKAALAPDVIRAAGFTLEYAAQDTVKKVDPVFFTKMLPDASALLISALSGEM
jgi:hypothetical protein